MFAERIPFHLKQYDENVKGYDNLDNTRIWIITSVIFDANNCKKNYTKKELVVMCEVMDKIFPSKDIIDSHKKDV